MPRSPACANPAPHACASQASRGRSAGSRAAQHRGQAHRRRPLADRGNARGIAPSRRRKDLPLAHWRRRDPRAPRRGRPSASRLAPQPTILFDRAARPAHRVPSGSAHFLAESSDLQPRRHGRGRRQPPRRLRAPRQPPYSPTRSARGPVADILDAAPPRGAYDSHAATQHLMRRLASTRLARFWSRRPAPRARPPSTICWSCAQRPATAAPCRRTWSR